MFKQFDDKLNLLSHFFMLLLMAASVYYCQERMLHTDNANLTFWLINTKDYSTAHGRFPVYLTQFLIIWGIKLKLSVKWLIMLYSLNFYLLYYLAFLLTAFFYKNATIAYLIVLSLVIMTHDIFFLQTEVMHGIVFALLFAAYLLHQPVKTSTKLVSHFFGITAFVIAAFFHQISCIFLVIIIGWYLLCSGKFTSYKAYAYLLAAIGILWYKLAGTTAGSYEANYYSNAPGIMHTLKHFKDSGVFIFYYKYSQSIYLLPNILLLAGLVWLVIKQKYLQALYIAAAYTGYFILISSMFILDSQIMMERIYLPLGAIICLAIAFALKDISFNESRSRSALALSVLAIILVLGMNNIINAAPKYTRRLNQVKMQAEKLQTQEGHRFYTYTKDVDKTNEFPFWAAACEQILYSAIHYPQNIKTMYLFDDSTQVQNTLINEPLLGNEFLYAPFAPKFDTSFLNPDYFRIRHDQYQYINFN